MRIGIIGAGHIGGGTARQLGAAGHEIKVSFSRDRAALESLARQIGPGASVGTPAEAVQFGEVVVISVPWSALPEALEQAGSLAGKVMVDRKSTRLNSSYLGISYAVFCLKKK